MSKLILTTKILTCSQPLKAAEVVTVSQKEENQDKGKELQEIHSQDNLFQVQQERALSKEMSGSGKRVRGSLSASDSLNFETMVQLW